MNYWRQLRAEIEIEGPVAWWVLGAHLYALLLPLSLVWAAERHAVFLESSADFPGLINWAAVLLCIGSAFEIAQNTRDRWYLTPDTGSANGVGLCDFLSFWFVCQGQALLAIAIAGKLWWVTALGAGCVLAFPVAYLRQVAHFAPIGVATLLAAAFAWLRFGDPIVFVQFALTGLTLFFFALLLKTGAQALHGLTTMAAASGVLLFPLAISNGARGESLGWSAVVLVFLASGLLALLARPALSRLPASARLAS